MGIMTSPGLEGLRGKRVALAAEWLGANGGGERVFSAVAGMLPDAELYALSIDGTRAAELSRPVRTSFLDAYLDSEGRRAVALPLMPLAWRMLGASESFDVVLSFSNACVKGFAAGRRTIHLQYCHAPMRYVWTPELDSRGGKAPLLQKVGRPVMRRWDRRATRWVDHFAANSHEVAARVERFYGRIATVVYPPVDLSRFTPSAEKAVRTSVPAEYAIFVGRLVSYKRVDIAIRASAMAGLPLVVVGSGPQSAQARAIAASIGADVTWVGSPSDEELRWLYVNAIALIFPAHEDFGIVPLEAQACGTPVVAYSAGGALETVIDGVTGVHVKAQDPALFAEALRYLVDHSFAAEAFARQVDQFSQPQFEQSFSDWVTKCLESSG